MRLFRSYLHLPETARRGVAVLGNFDGLHRGHQAVIGHGAALAIRTAGPALAALGITPDTIAERVRADLGGLLAVDPSVTVGPLPAPAAPPERATPVADNLG